MSLVNEFYGLIHRLVQRKSAAGNPPERPPGLGVSGGSYYDELWPGSGSGTYSDERERPFASWNDVPGYRGGDTWNR
jgi:hypothetical protein